MSTPPYNGHRQLLRQFRAILATENELTHEQKERNQYQILQKVCGTQIIVAKGGINTCFIIFGKNVNKRQLMYPHDACQLLERLANQSHRRYVLVDSESESTFQELAPRLKRKPTLKAKIYGINEETMERELAYRAKTNVAGKLYWHKVWKNNEG